MKMINREMKMRCYERMRRWLTNHARHCMMEQEPRRWSNRELKKMAPLFSGDVLNVSGWRDEDKEGGCYRDYFSKASAYKVTNYFGTDGPDDGMKDSLFLDLEQALPADMASCCDLAWTHTVLEHVADVETSVKNLGGLTRDAVLVVVPWMQDEHYSPSLYGDYWRFTPMGMKRLMELAGCELIHLAANDQPWYPVYLLAIGSKKADAWSGVFPRIDWNRRLGQNQYNYPGCIS